jgi:hypothetical protein
MHKVKFIASHDIAKLEARANQFLEEGPYTKIHKIFTFMNGDCPTLWIHYEVHDYVNVQELPKELT